MRKTRSYNDIWRYQKFSLTISKQSQGPVKHNPIQTHITYYFDNFLISLHIKMPEIISL